MKPFGRRNRLRGEVEVLRTELREIRSTPVAIVPDLTPEVRKLRAELERVGAEHAALQASVEADRQKAATAAKAAQPKPAPPKGPFEILLLLDEVQHRELPFDSRLATSMIQKLGRSDRDESIYALCKNVGMPFIEACATLRVLHDAGVVDINTKSRMGERVTLTASGRLVAETFIGVAPLPPKAPPKPYRPAYLANVLPPEPAPEPQPEPVVPVVDPRVAAQRAFATSLASAAGITYARAQGSKVGIDALRKVVLSLLDYSDQPLSNISKRNGLTMMEAAEASRLLSNAGLVFIAGSSGGDDRGRLTEEGRAFANALKGVAPKGKALG